MQTAWPAEPGRPGALALCSVAVDPALRDEVDTAGLLALDAAAYCVASNRETQLAAYRAIAWAPLAAPAHRYTADTLPQPAAPAGLADGAAPAGPMARAFVDVAIDNEAASAAWVARHRTEPLLEPTDPAVCAYVHETEAALDAAVRRHLVRPVGELAGSSGTAPRAPRLEKALAQYLTLVAALLIHAEGGTSSAGARPALLWWAGLDGPRGARPPACAGGRAG